MNNAGDVMNRPNPVTIDGQTYQFYPLQFRDYGDLQRFIDGQCRNPLDLLRGKLDGFTPQQQNYLMQAAMEAARKPGPTLGTPEADRILATSGGVKEVLYLSLRRGDPAYTREKVSTLFDQMSEPDIALALAAAVQRQPGENGAPKAAGDSPSPSTGGGSSES